MDGGKSRAPVAAPAAASHIEKSKSWTEGRTRPGTAAALQNAGSEGDAGGDSSPPRLKIRLGICAMDKKARARPMTALLKRLDGMGDFECIIFGNECILERPVEEVRDGDDWRGWAKRARDCRAALNASPPPHTPLQWPLCDCLISFFSGGFPLEKAQSYVALRRPFMVNDLDMEHKLRDRREVYRLLWKAGVPQARWVEILFCDRL